MSDPVVILKIIFELLFRKRNISFWDPLADEDAEKTKKKYESEIHKCLFFKLFLIW